MKYKKMKPFYLFFMYSVISNDSDIIITYDFIDIYEYLVILLSVNSLLMAIKFIFHISQLKG